MEEMKVKTGKFRKLIMFMFMLVVAGVVCGVAYVIAEDKFKTTKEEVLKQESGTLSTWTQNTVSTINLWTDSLIAQSKRVSSSELFRLFATEAASLNNEEALLLNEEEVGVSSLSEQVPLMRNVLVDFINLNGYVDARLLDNEGVTFLASQARPAPIDDVQVNVAKESIKNNATSFAPIVRYQNGLLMHFADPLSPVLTQDDDAGPIGTLLLSSPVISNIALFLTYDNQSGANTTPYIVQKNGDNFEIVDEKSMQFSSLSKDYVDLQGESMPFAYRPSVSDPNVFVWSSAVFVPRLNWWVVVEIPADYIKAKLDEEAVKIYGFAATLTAGFILVLALLWWIAVGREQKANAKRFESLFNLIDDQKRILDNVNAALDTGLLAADITGQIIMANRAFMQLCSCKNDNLEGENIAPIFDPTFTHELLSGIAKASETAKSLTAEYSAMLGKETRLLRLTFYPFLDNEVPAAEGEEKPKVAKAPRKYQNAALITFTDITEFRRQSNAKRHVQEKSMQALVRAVESMDPYLSGHSRRMEQLGVLVCQAMHLPDNDVNTVAIAANLSQIGKLFISRDLLLKQGSLTADEKAQLLSIPEKAWLTLKEIDFHLPVPEAVHDMYERLDGKGYPRKLPVEEIAVHARILGVVNTFCAMTAPRSYRRGITIDDALEFLRSDHGYDQNVVSALDAVLRTPEGLQVARALPENPGAV